MPKDTKITIRISEEEKDALKQLAFFKDVPMSQLIREAIREIIEKGENK